MDTLPPCWQKLLAVPAEKLEKIMVFVESERAAGTVYPPAGSVFAALEATPPEEVKAVIVGQDPYHEPGQAHGLSFSVPAGCRLPPSLRNIFREMASDLEVDPPISGDLSSWAEQGVLLLNSVLTVRAGAAGSHRGHGWEAFTDAVLRTVNRSSPPCVFILWGSDAIRKRAIIDETRHRVLAGPHPSPLSAYRGFFGSRPFSRTNTLLRELGRPEIDWLAGLSTAGVEEQLSLL